MELKGRHPSPNMDERTDLVRFLRDAPPRHYIFKIESFSLLLESLSKTGLDQYETRDFEAGGYSWRLKLYPNGNERDNGSGYISLYLVMSKTDTLFPGFEVPVIFKFFVYDHIWDKYLTIHDEKMRRYHAARKEWGLPQLLPLETFKDNSNGYLVDDICLFGAEVFVLNCKGRGESLSIITEPVNSSFAWRINKFSGLTNDFYFSDLFTVGGCQWKLCLYPNGNTNERFKSLSFYLTLYDYSNLPSGWRMFVEFKLRIWGQRYGNHYEQTFSGWLCAATTRWGSTSFMSLRTLKDASNGFIVNDTLVLEGKIVALSHCDGFLKN